MYTDMTDWVCSTNRMVNELSTFFRCLFKYSSALVLDEIIQSFHLPEISRFTVTEAFADEPYLPPPSSLYMYRSRLNMYSKLHPTLTLLEKVFEGMSSAATH